MYLGLVIYSASIGELSEITDPGHAALNVKC